MLSSMSNRNPALKSENGVINIGVQTGRWEATGAMAGCLYGGGHWFLTRFTQGLRL
jgi:hypothetical protein